MLGLWLELFRVEEGGFLEPHVFRPLPDQLVRFLHELLEAYGVHAAEVLSAVQLRTSHGYVNLGFLERALHEYLTLYPKKAQPVSYHDANIFGPVSYHDAPTYEPAFPSSRAVRSMFG